MWPDYAGFEVHVARAARQRGLVGGAVPTMEYGMGMEYMKFRAGPDA